MTIRKGQHLFNKIVEYHELYTHQCDTKKNSNMLLPYYNLHQILFYMPDEEFNAIMLVLPKEGIYSER